MNKSLTKTYNWISLRLICARFSVVIEIFTEFYTAFPEIMVIFAILFGYRYLNNSVFGFVMLLGYCISVYLRDLHQCGIYLHIAQPYVQYSVAIFITWEVGVGHPWIKQRPSEGNSCLNTCIIFGEEHCHWVKFRLWVNTAMWFTTARCHYNVKSIHNSTLTVSEGELTVFVEYSDICNLQKLPCPANLWSSQQHNLQFI